MISVLRKKSAVAALATLMFHGASLTASQRSLCEYCMRMESGRSAKSLATMQPGACYASSSVSTAIF